MIIKKIFVVLNCLCFIMPLIALSAEKSLPVKEKKDALKLLFHLTCNKSTKADFAAGNATPLVQKNIKFVKGKNGQAIRLGKDSLLRFASEGNLNRQRGTVAMWVRPHWNAEEKDDHVFFTDDRDFFKKEPNTLMLWEWYKGKMRFDIRDKDGTYLRYNVKWKKDEWHHISATWDWKTGICMFVDGSLVAIKSIRLDPSESKFFQFGAALNGKWPADSDIEDVKIYNRALNVGQIKQVMSGKSCKSLSRLKNKSQKICDFETKREVNIWSLRSPKQDTLKSSEKFATSGKHSLVFKTPKWEEGMEHWPAFECKPLVSDWSKYQQLSIDITNPTENPQVIRCFISDSKKRLLRSLQALNIIEPFSHKRVTIPLSFGRCNVDASKIKIMHFVTEPPAADYCLYLDNFVLSDFDTPASPLPHKYKKQVAELRHAFFLKAKAKIAKLKNKIHTKVSDKKNIYDWSLKKITLLENRLENVKKTEGAVFVNNINKIINSCKRLQNLIVFRRNFDKIRHKIEKQNEGDSSFAIGFATAMEKLLPMDMPLPIKAATEVNLTLAKNEKESFQLVVLPFDKQLQNVKITAEDLKDKQGEILKASNINIKVVGYVKTKKSPPYDVPYVGWWPDPILNFNKKVNVAAGNAQAFWIRVNAGKTQKSGTYSGKLCVTAKDAKPMEFKINVKVYDFILPDSSPLPMAITFEPRNVLKLTGKNSKNWHKKLKYIWADFLADYYITYDNLYRTGAPDYEVLDYLNKQGRLGYFNLGNLINAGTSKKFIDKDIEECLSYLRPAYQKAKKRNILDRAYIYGFDELPKAQFPFLQKAASVMKKNFPEVKVMTTAKNASYGTIPGTSSIDIWCPITGNYNSKKAVEARKIDKQVWWYICCWPVHPYVNWFLEYPAIEARLLMGAMAAKYRPDGFLYYHINLWKGEPIKTGPFTNWDPVSYSNFHGDGSLTCVDNDGKPVPTIRLENFRDGLEDYHYVCLLEKKINDMKSMGSLSKSQKQWLKNAESLLKVPQELIKNLRDFTNNPAVLYDYRSKIAEAIETAN